MIDSRLLVSVERMLPPDNLRDARVIIGKQWR
jgi:hypothetical protein